MCIVYRHNFSTYNSRPTGRLTDANRTYMGSIIRSYTTHTNTHILVDSGEKKPVFHDRVYFFSVLHSLRKVRAVTARPLTTIPFILLLCVCVLCLLLRSSLVLRRYGYCIAICSRSWCATQWAHVVVSWAFSFAAIVVACSFSMVFFFCHFFYLLHHVHLTPSNCLAVCPVSRLAAQEKARKIVVAVVDYVIVAIFYFEAHHLHICMRRREGSV